MSGKISSIRVYHLNNHTFLINKYLYFDFFVVFFCCVNFNKRRFCKLIKFLIWTIFFNLIYGLYSKKIDLKIKVSFKIRYISEKLTKNLQIGILRQLFFLQNFTKNTIKYTISKIKLPISNF